MKILFYPCIIIILCFFSCTYNTKEQKSSCRAVESIEATHYEDTTIIYDIEGISAEGVEAIARYSNNRITDCTVNIYGETGQANINYTFINGKIIVKEKKYTYQKQLKETPTQKDMNLTNDVIYEIDYKGNITGKEVKNRIDIFKEIKDNVPFELK